MLGGYGVPTEMYPQTDQAHPPIPQVVNDGQYILERQIGAGSFGHIFKGVHVLTGEPVAIKLEPSNIWRPQLLHEAKLYVHLHWTSPEGTSSKPIGFPRVYWYGVEGAYNVMVMELLGPSLEVLFMNCGRTFSIKTVLMLADQMVGRLEYLHSRCLVHRDVKPDNFAIGLSCKSRVVHLLDFGLSKMYCDSKRSHVPYSEGRGLTGTARYSSINTHMGVEQSRRDDLEALGHLFIYFLHGRLPWQGLQPAIGEDKYTLIGQRKISTPTWQLCFGLPEEFAAYLNYCRKLRFDDKPDYQYLRLLFTRRLMWAAPRLDFVFDWHHQSGTWATEQLDSTHQTSRRHTSRRKSNRRRYQNPDKETEFLPATVRFPTVAQE